MYFSGLRAYIATTTLFTGQASVRAGTLQNDEIYAYSIVIRTSIARTSTVTEVAKSKTHPTIIIAVFFG